MGLSSDRLRPDEKINAQQNPASDGEEYFATALLFASSKWGDGTGIYNYSKEDNLILNTMLHKEEIAGGIIDSVVNMFNRSQKMITFVPYASAALFSDPSYHLPAFYEIWARLASGYVSEKEDRNFWLQAAEASRAHFKAATNAKTYNQYSLAGIPLSGDRSPGR